MNVAILKETLPGENRVAAIPATVKEMVKSDMKVLVESGAGIILIFQMMSIKMPEQRLFQIGQIYWPIQILF
jgi:alanine dehydrogenase